MDSESFSFVESALVFGLLEDQNFKKFNHPISQFVVHKDAIEWSMKFRDDFKEAVDNGALLEKYPSLRADARDTNFDYAQQEFKKQVLFRQVIKSFSDNKTLLSSNPKAALTSIVNSLADVEVGYDEDVTQYDDGEIDRLAEYKDRVEKRSLGEGMIGIRTPFRTINATGMGWQPGELVSFFARPTVGKTWLCVKIACEAALQGKKTLLISTEMPKQSIGMRVDVVMANMMGIKLSHHAIRTGSQMDIGVYKKFYKVTIERIL